MPPATHRRTLEIDQGLFLIRYATAEDAVQPPTVKISHDHSGAATVTLILHPGHNDAILLHPRSSLLVRSSGPATLAVEVTSENERGSTAVALDVERLTQGIPALQSSDGSSAGRSAVDLDVRDLEILGHVAGIGDITVAAGNWLAGPLAPSRIEGLSLQWPGKPQGLNISYSVRLAKPSAKSTRMTSLGSFVGTRGHALPIIAMALEMTGAMAKEYAFVVDAIFLGSPIKTSTGRRIVLTGPAGRETLVGLRINIVAASDPRLHPATPAKPFNLQVPEPDIPFAEARTPRADPASMRAEDKAAARASGALSASENDISSPAVENEGATSSGMSRDAISPPSIPDQEAAAVDRVGELRSQTPSAIPDSPSKVAPSDFARALAPPQAAYPSASPELCLIDNADETALQLPPSRPLLPSVMSHPEGFGFLTTLETSSISADSPETVAISVDRPKPSIGTQKLRSADANDGPDIPRDLSSYPLISAPTAPPRDIVTITDAAAFCHTSNSSGRTSSAIACTIGAARAVQKTSRMTEDLLDKTLFDLFIELDRLYSAPKS